MKNFLAVYIGSEASVKASGWDALDDAERQARQQKGMEAWSKWADAHRDAIVENGSPLGKTLRISKRGVESIKN